MRSFAVTPPSTTPSPIPRVLALKAARVCLDEIGDIDRAIAYLRLAYESDPELVPARELLLQLLTVNNAIEEAYDLLRAQPEAEHPSLRAHVQYRLGLLAEALARNEKDPAAAVRRSDAALQHYRSALAHQPDHGLAAERSRRLLVSHNDLPNLTRFLRGQADGREGSERAAILVQIARLHISRGDEGLGDARACYEEALEASPADVLVRREFENLLRRLRNDESLPAVYLQTLRHVEDPNYRATLFVEAAELLFPSSKEEDRELAASAILEALRAAPGNPYAVRHLDRLLSSPDSPLIATEAVSARAVRAQSDAERAIFYLESAELLERAASTDQARRAYQAALKELPELLPAELGLQRVQRQAKGSPPPLAREGSQLISLHNLMAEASDAAIAFGHERTPRQAERAIANLDRILTRSPSHRDALALSRSLVGQLSDPAPALALLARNFPKIDDPELCYEVALFLGEHTPQLKDAVRYLEVAVERKPGSKQALQALIACYRQLGQDRKAAGAIDKLLKLCAPGDPSAIDLRIGLAAFLGNESRSRGRALEHARIALRARPDDPRAILLLADLLERNQEPVEAAQLLERLLARERDRAKIHELRFRQAQLFAKDPATSTKPCKRSMLRSVSARATEIRLRC